MLSEYWVLTGILMFILLFGLINHPKRNLYGKSFTASQTKISKVIILLALLFLLVLSLLVLLGH